MMNSRRKKEGNAVSETLAFSATFVEIEEYVERKLENGKKIFARKTGRILVSNLDKSEFETYTLIGRESFVRGIADPANYVIATQLGKDNKPTLTCQGRKNQWVLSKERLNQKYYPILEEPGVFAPRGDIETFLKVEEDIAFVLPICEDSVEILKKGGFLNISDPGHYYGIQEEDFERTYEEVTE